MNERIRQLARQVDLYAFVSDESIDPDIEKFAELIVKECCVALNPMLRDMISRGQGADLIKKHFGVEE